MGSSRTSALATAAAARLFGLDWPLALLLGAIVSSTDAAAVFSTLAASGTHLKRRVAGNQLESVDVSGKTPKLLDTVKLSSAWTNNLLLSGTHLLVLSRGGYWVEPLPAMAARMFAPVANTSVLTEIDVSDPSSGRQCGASAVIRSVTSANDATTACGRDSPRRNSGLVLTVIQRRSSSPRLTPISTSLHGCPVSSVRTAWLTAEVLTPRKSAAARNERRSATATKACRAASVGFFIVKVAFTVHHRAAGCSALSGP